MRRGGALAGLQPGTIADSQHGTLADFCGDSHVVDPVFFDNGGFCIVYFTFSGNGSVPDFGPFYQFGVFHWVFGYFGICR